MSSRLLTAARAAAAIYLRNGRYFATSRVVRDHNSVTLKDINDGFISTLKRDIMHPETRPESKG